MSIKNTCTELLTNVFSLSFCITQELISLEHLQLESGGVRHTLQLVVREEVSTSSLRWLVLLLCP
jgi:hypothetical protein